MQRKKFTLLYTLCFIFFLSFTISISSSNFLSLEKKDKLRNLGSTNCTAKIEKSGNFVIKCEKEGEKNAKANKNINFITEKMKNEDIANFMQLGQIAKENNKKVISAKNFFDPNTLKKKHEILIQFLMMPGRNADKEAVEGNRNWNFLQQADEEQTEKVQRNAYNDDLSSLKDFKIKILPEEENEANFSEDNKNKKQDLIPEKADSFSFFHSVEI